MPVIPGAILPVRPIGVLEMEDEAGPDAKILPVPIDRITQIHGNTKTYRDIPGIDLARIAYFFENGKDLEPDERVKIVGLAEPERAHALINEAIARSGWRPPNG